MQTGIIQYEFFLGWVREGCSFFKKNIPPAILFFVPKIKMCLFSLEDEQTHIIRGTTSIGAFAPTSNPDNGGIPKGHTDGENPCSGLGSAAAIPHSPYRSFTLIGSLLRECAGD